jgi:rare lipoprotein A
MLKRHRTRHDHDMKEPAMKQTRALLFAIACCLGGGAWAGHAPEHKSGHKSGPAAGKSAKKQGLDHSGKTHKGRASYYAGKFNGRKMADGTRYNPNSNAAASKTLPLGTRARVTNLETGKSDVVEVRDRGPYVPGRIMDVTPKVADKLEMKKDGVAPVEVKPIEVPQPDGSVKPGSGAGGGR